MHLSVVTVTDIDWERNTFQNGNRNKCFSGETQTVQKLFVCWHATQPAHVLETHPSHGVLKRIGNKREASSLCGMLHPVSMFQCDASYVRACSIYRKCKYKMPLIIPSFFFLLKKHERWSKLVKMYRMGRLDHIKKIRISCYSVQCFNAAICFALSFFPHSFPLFKICWMQSCNDMFR